MQVQHFFHFLSANKYRILFAYMQSTACKVPASACKSTGQRMQKYRLPYRGRQSATIGCRINEGDIMSCRFLLLEL